MVAPSKERRTVPLTESGNAVKEPVPSATTPPARAEKPKPAPPSGVPYLLDFFPLETIDQTRLAPFYERLRAGRLSTTKCAGCGAVHWPPRIACPECHGESLSWVDLPETGRLYAFSAVLAGAPLGMEADMPFAVGLVDLDGASLRLLGRIDGRPWEELRVGSAVRFESFDLPDGRVFYRFRALD